MPAGALWSVTGAGQELEERYAADAWHAGQLGVPAARGRNLVTFTGIEQAWLRQAAKRWARQRLSTGHAFNTIRAGAAALKRFSDFLADCAPPAPQPQQDCPHPNACLTCPDFQTTVEFLPTHRQQADLIRELLNAAEASGRQRQADNHRKVLISLDSSSNGDWLRGRWDRA